MQILFNTKQTRISPGNYLVSMMNSIDKVPDSFNEERQYKEYKIAKEMMETGK